MIAKNNKFILFMDNIISLLDEWSITEYKLRDMQSKQFSVPEGLINHKKSIINKIEGLIMEHNDNDLKKLHQ